MEYKLKFLRSILNSMSEGVLVVNQATSKIVLYNEKFLSMWGIDQATLDTLDSLAWRKAILSKVVRPEEFQKKIDEAVANKEQETFDIIEVLGDKFYERRSVILDLEDGGLGRLNFFRDITKEYKKSAQDEKTLHDHELLLINSAQLTALGEMAGNIAHEINNPLAIIKMSSRCLKELTNDPHEIDQLMIVKMISAIDNTVERIARTVVGLRNISRKPTDEKIKCNIEDILNDVLGIASEKLKVLGIRVNQNHNQEIMKSPLLLNRIEISQVLINLLNNSADALELVDPADKWIEIRTEVHKDTLQILVTDGGKGIPLDIKDKIFSPFFTTKEIGKGTGIGLPLSKTLIEKNGGMFYYDENAVNTRFVISLPNTIPLALLQAVP